MREVTVKLYKYSELSDSAKEKAREWYLNGWDFNFGWDCIKEDAKSVHFALKEWEYRRYLRADFIGSAQETATAIVADHGDVCDTHKLATAYLKAIGAEGVTDEQREAIDYDFLVDLCEAYRVMTDRDYEAEQTEEYIADVMECNEYEFLESGKRA